MDHRFSTDAVRLQDRISYWKDAVCATFVRLDVDCDARAPFHSDLTVRHGSRFDLIDVHGSPQRVMRGASQIREDESASLIVMRQLQGEGLAAQHGRELKLTPQSLGVLDSRRPYSLDFPVEFGQIVIKLPVALLEQRLGRCALCTGAIATRDTALGRLTCGAIDELARERDGSTAQLAGIALDLLLLSLAPLCTSPDAPPRMASMRVAWAKAFVASSLCDPGLTPARVAAAQGVSVRLLQRLFAAEGGSLSEFILEQRLVRCDRALQDAAQARRSITDLALESGFNDPSQFAKAFRRRFACTPSDRRRRSQSSA
jgi:AraC family transcriptional regulator, positive regulator of tynA and feaB